LLLKIYRALIRSKAEYGSTIFRFANQKYLKKIDTPLNTGIRFSLGCFKSSPIKSLRNLANELPSDIRRKYNIFLYTARLLISIENPSSKYLAKNIKEAKEYHIDLQHRVKRIEYTLTNDSKEKPQAPRCTETSSKIHYKNILTTNTLHPN
jgi:hypothetical protein